MNTLIEYPLPDWIGLLFLTLIPLPFILILSLLRKTATKMQHPRLFWVPCIFFIFYLAYIYFASVKGWFWQVGFPPRVLLFTTFPYAFLLFIVILNLPIYRKVIEKIKVSDLIRLHIFRVVGVFFLIFAFHQALPKYFAIIAGCGDMITALTSFWIARKVDHKEASAKKWAYAWNIFGTVDIIYTAVGANVLTKLSIDIGIMGVDTLARFPFCIIPAFAPPTILFLHFIIFKKLSVVFRNP